VACAYAKNSGYFVILFCKSILNYKQNIFKNCDSVIEIDTTKISELINETIKLQQKFCIKAVTTTSDFFVVQAAQLCEYLNLPGNSVSSVENIKNKLIMRNEIQKFKPELNPQYFHALSFEDAIIFATKNGFPFIAKPINGNDSLHVKKISNTYDLQKYFNDRNRWGVDVSGQNFENGVLLESFVQGTEYCLDLLKSVSGKLILSGAFKKMLAGTEQGYFLKIGASFPASSMDTDLLFKEISPLVDDEEQEINEFSGVGAIVGYTGPLGVNPDELGRKKKKTSK
jgi:argininosuccinate lyase